MLTSTPLFADIASDITGNVIGWIMDQLAQFFLKPGVEALQQANTYLDNMPFLDLTQGWFKEKYAVAYAIGLAIAFPVGFIRAIGYFRNKKRMVRSASFGPGHYIISGFVPIIYYFMMIGAGYLTLWAGALGGDPGAYDKLFTIPGVTGPIAFVISFWTFVLGIILEIEAVLIQAWGYPMLILWPIALACLPLGKWGRRFFDVVTAGALMSLLGRPLMRAVLAIGSQIGPHLSDLFPLADWIAAAINLTIMSAAAIFPFVVFAGYKHFMVKVTGGSLNAKTEGGSSGGSSGGGSSKAPARHAVEAFIGGAAALKLEQGIKARVAHNDSVAAATGTTGQRTSRGREIAASGLRSATTTLAARGAGVVATGGTAALGMAVAAAPRRKSPKTPNTPATQTPRQGTPADPDSSARTPRPARPIPTTSTPVPPERIPPGASPSRHRRPSPRPKPDTPEGGVDK